MKASKDEIVEEESTPGCYIKTRWVLAWMGFLGIFNVYSLRTNLSVAIVAMVNATIKEDPLTNQSTLCPDRGQSSSSTAYSNGAFNWGPAQQGLALGCYFYGYIVSNVPGAWLARRVGFKKVFGISMMLSSIITICTPAAASNSFELFVSLRVILGFLQGVSFPTMHGAWSSWAPPAERSSLISIHMSGSSFGTCVTLPLAAVIADELGWEAVFYFTGGIGLMWSFCWLAIIHDSPETHPRISEQEKKYITRSIGVDKIKGKVEKGRIPWLSMLTSLPVLGILCGHFAGNWGNYTLLAMLPTYLSTILKFNIKSSGFLSALPYILQWIFTVVGGYITDVIRRKQLLSTVVIRKINTGLGLIIPAMFIALAGYIGCDATAAAAFFSLSVAFNALTVPGCKANVVDIAPQYGGIIYGISNTLSNIPGFLTPLVAGILLQDNNSLSQWQTVFWIAAGVYIGGAAVYLLVGSGVEQAWAKGAVTKKDNVAEDCSNEENDDDTTKL